ncbi:hypothetical protein OA519_02155 [Candidatus Pelagibacter sp.]|nr:hypothetical protein [Candidatus Pelagibacter sp.]
MKKFDIRDSIFQAVYEHFNKDKNCFFLTADQGSFGYNILSKKFPSRVINVGIAEQNMVGIAAGLALEKKTVYIYAISSFLYSRAYEQIKLNLCSMNLKVCIILSGPGLCYAPDGPTHYSLEDIMMLNNLPNLKIFSPYDKKTSSIAINNFKKGLSPCVIRCDKGEFIEQKVNSLDSAEILKGKKNVIVSHGFFINYFYQHQKILKKHDIGLIGINKIKEFNLKKFIKISKNYKNIYYVDEAWLNASFGIHLSNILISNGVTKNLRILALKNKFLKKGGNRLEILKNNNLDMSSILKIIC